MLADIVAIVWLLMVGFVGLRRGWKRELFGLLILIASSVIARLLALVLYKKMTAVFALGPLGTQIALFLIFWLLVYATIMAILHFFRSSESHISIPQNPDGSPNLLLIRINRFFGFSLGMLRGAVLYIGIMGALVVLMPIATYKAQSGKGVAIVYPGSVSLKVVHLLDIDLRRFQAALTGLHVLHNLRCSPLKKNKLRRTKKGTVRKKVTASQTPLHLTPSCQQARQLLTKEHFSRLQQQQDLLRRVAQTKQHKKALILLVRYPPFQHLLVQRDLVSRLGQLSLQFPHHSRTSHTKK